MPRKLQRRAMMKIKGYSFNLAVILAMIIGAIIVGALNNIRVYEEQRVSWWTTQAETAE